MTAVEPASGGAERLLHANRNGASSGRVELERAIVRAVAYSDVFDHPLTAAEIHRYLVGMPASADEVLGILRNGSLVGHVLACSDGYFMLAGREAIVDTRRRRAALATRLWPRALRYGRAIAGLPFVRMVAITGQLAVDSVDRNADIDYLIVTEPGRLWFTRALIIGIVRLARCQGDVVCPNYLLSERALELRERNLYTAHELAQMVPLAGLATYDRMRRLNGWTQEYLPNALGPAWLASADLVTARAPRRVAEVTLRSPAVDRLERWEMERKIRRFSRNRQDNVEVDFSADWCKGHFDGHGQRTLAAYADRLRTLEGLLP